MSDIKRDMAMDSMARLTGPITQDVAMQMLAARLDHAREKHPVFATSDYGAFGVIESETWELEAAIVNKEGPARIVDEALDVAATAMRLVMGEVKL